MVKITFKLSEAGTITLDVAVPATLASVLQKASKLANVELGGFIAVRGGKVITANDLVEKDDEIDVFPAISGG